MTHRILTSLDRKSKNEVNAALCLFVDWKQTYSRQCHFLGIQDRRMQVRWHGVTSEPRKLPGDGAMGATLGNWEYISQTNNNANFIPEEDRYKFVDDLTVLEIINLLNIGLSSHNIKQHVPSDVPDHGQWIDNMNLQSQEYLNQLNNWSEKHKMIISQTKTKAMIIKFNHNYQFGTHLQLQESNIEIVDQMKILGTIFTNTLSWDRNCAEIIQKS